MANILGENYSEKIAAKSKKITPNIRFTIKKFGTLNKQKIWKTYQCGNSRSKFKIKMFLKCA